MNKRKLPVGGVQVFGNLRREYDVYVDKTMHIYNMASRYKTVFLSRPRRFGKSLLCSAIESLFSNQKELFEGLAITKTDWEWKMHPVIHLGLGAGNFTNNGTEKLIDTLNTQLDKACDNYGISIESSNNIADRFDRVITELSKKKGNVVVIIDEYDNPLLNTINQPELNAKLREELKGFYSVIKQNKRYMLEYCDICGITQEDLETFFAPEIDAYAPRHGGREKYLERLKEYYNGYFFTRKKLSVYNTLRDTEPFR